MLDPFRQFVENVMEMIEKRAVTGAERAASVAGIFLRTITNQATDVTTAKRLSQPVYSSDVAKHSASKAWEKLSEAVDTALKEAVVLERNGQPAAVLVSPDHYEEMIHALEVVRDVSAFDAAMEDDDGSNIPWEQVRADLGWT